MKLAVRLGTQIRLWRSLVWALPTLFVPRGVLGQTPDSVIHVRDAFCDCRISLDEIARLGDEAQGWFQSATRIVRRPTGEYVLLDTQAQRIVEYDSRGRFVRDFERRGPGPGEFMHMIGMGLVDGNLHIYDASKNQLVVLDRDYVFVRSLPLPLAVRDVTVFPDGSAVILGLNLTRAAIGYPLWSFDASGAEIARFGEDPVEGFSPYNRLWLTRALYNDGEALWGSRRTQFRVEQWDLNGRLRRAFVRELDWFQPYRAAVPGNNERPPQPSLVAALPDADGILWTLTRVADPNWTSGIRPVSYGGEEGFTTVPSLYADTDISAIDLERGTVIASTRSDVFLSSFIAPGIAYGTVSNRDDEPSAVIYRLTLNTNQE